MEDKNSALENELKAARANMRLLAQSQGIKPHEVNDYILAMELNADQIQAAEDEANGEELVTAASGSSSRTEPTLRPNKKKKSSTSAKSAGGAKPTAKGTPKHVRVQKVASGTPTSGLKKPLHQAKRPRNEKVETARNGHNMRNEFNENRASTTITESSTGTGNEQKSRANTDNEADDTGNDSHATKDKGQEQRHDEQFEQPGYEQFEDATDLDSSVEDITPATEADDGAVEAERALALRKKMKKKLKKRRG